jgi:hypothetical protein
LAPHLLELDSKSSVEAFPEIGSIVKECTVLRQDPGIDALLALPESFNRDPETLTRQTKKSGLFKNQNGKLVDGFATGACAPSSAFAMLLGNP